MKYFALQMCISVPNTSASSFISNSDFKSSFTSINKLDDSSVDLFLHVQLCKVVPRRIFLSSLVV